MNQKYLGIVLLAIGVLLFLSIYSYTSTIITFSAELHKNCPLPEEICPYKRTVPFESYFGFALSVMVALAGGYLIFSQKGMERFATAERTKLRKVAKNLEGEEKQIYELLAKSDGTMFQNDIMQKTGFSKVKVSRLLDRLETKGLVERRRRGMTNIVIIK